MPKETQLIINIDEENSSLRVSEVSKYLEINKPIYSYRIGIRMIVLVVSS